MKILVLGATGAMGKYLVPQLCQAGHLVVAAALDGEFPELPGLKTIHADLKNREVREQLMGDADYDVIVDFLIYPTSELAANLPWLTSHCGQYIYLSSYRIYDDKEHPVRETSPRLIDACSDEILRNSDDYCIYKARGENMLQALPQRNWTAIRPAITYSLYRYQLVTLECDDTIGRAREGKVAVLPIQAKNIHGTMSWASDVARLICGLAGNSKALGEIFTVSTSEHHTWGEIAEYYQEICGLKVRWVDMEDYVDALQPKGSPYRLGCRWQLQYDRLFTRIIDNSKVLAVTGITQDSFTSLYDGLKYELERCPKEQIFHPSVNMDKWLAAHPL